LAKFGTIQRQKEESLGIEPHFGELLEPIVQMWRFHFFGGSKYGDYKKFLIMSQLWAIFSVALAWM
jgi:hypothetical protein